MSNPEQYIEEAKKLENSKSVFEFLMKDMTFDRYEKIANLYEKSANIYKVDNKHQAVKYYIKAYNYYLQIDSHLGYETETKRILLEIAQLYQSINYVKSIESYEKLINYYTEKGDISNIIKYYEIIGNIYWTNNCVEESKQIYLKTKQISQIHDKCPDIKKRVIEKLIEILINSTNTDLTRYLEVSKLYFEIADENLNSRLGTYLAKKYILLGLIADCAGGDIVKAKKDLEKYSSLDYTFDKSADGQFAKSLIELTETNDSEGISLISERRDITNQLDNNQVKMLLDIKNQIEGAFEQDYENNAEQEEIDLC